LQNAHVVIRKSLADQLMLQVRDSLSFLSPNELQSSNLILNKNTLISKKIPHSFKKNRGL